MSKDQHLDARVDGFKAYLLTERDLARRTTNMRARIVRQWLREWDTLDPTRQDVETLKRDYILDGYDRGYIANICLAFHDWRREVMSGEEMGLFSRSVNSGRTKHRVVHVMGNP